MARVGVVTADFIARTAEFTQGVEKARKSLSTMDKAAKNTKNVLKGLFAAAATVGTGAFAADLAKATGETNRYAQALQIPIEQLSAMAFAVKTAGVESDKLGDMLKDVAEKVADAYANQGGEAVEVLERIGVSAEELNRLNPADQLLIIAEGLQELETQGERVQAMEALANNLSLLLPLVEDTGQGFTELEERMRRAAEVGAVITPEDAKSIGEAQKNLVELNAQMDRLGRGLATLVVPKLNAFFKAIQDGWALINRLTAQVQALYGALFSGELSLLDLILGDEEALARAKEIFDQAGKFQQGFDPRSGRTIIDIRGGTEVGLSEEQIKAYTAEVKKLRGEIEGLEDYLERIVARSRELIETGQAGTENYVKLQDHIQETITTLDELIAREIELHQMLGTQIEDTPIQDLKDRGQELLKLFDGLESESTKMDQAAQSIGLAFTSAFSQAIAQGARLEDVLRGLLADLAQIVLYHAVLEPLGNSIAKSISGSSVFDSLFGAARGGAFNTPLAAGVYTAPTVFPMSGSGPIKKFASGGILGEAGPEAVLPLTRMGGSLGVDARTAAPAVNVSINNLPGQGASVSEGADGTVQIDILRTQLASDILRGGSGVSRALETAYPGLRR